MPAGGALLDLLRHLVVPAAAIALPLAAMLERLQAQAMSEVIGEPFVLATLARGVPRSRVVWRDALKAALRPVAAVYGLIVGTLLSGSFAVEVITAWPGLGSLMLEALRTRDIYLVAGCAGAGALFLACGTLLSDVALAAGRSARERDAGGAAHDARARRRARRDRRCWPRPRRRSSRRTRSDAHFRRPAQRAADGRARRRRGRRVARAVHLSLAAA